MEHRISISCARTGRLNIDQRRDSSTKPFSRFAAVAQLTVALDRAIDARGNITEVPVVVCQQASEVLDQLSSSDSVVVSGKLTNSYDFDGERFDEVAIVADSITPIASRG